MSRILFINLTKSMLLSLGLLERLFVFGFNGITPITARWSDSRAVIVWGVGTLGRFVMAMSSVFLFLVGLSGIIGKIFRLSSRAFFFLRVLDIFV